ncbi:MAG TPA: hypothetical protein VGR25_07345 [bacterium]|nr:hypothetical protein [bacterium]
MLWSRPARPPYDPSLGTLTVDELTPAPADVRLWWGLLAAAAVLRAVIMPYGGFPTDIGTFKGWANGLAERGPAVFYGGGFADYLPGYLYVLWIIGELQARLRFNDQTFLFAIKLPATVADLIGAVLLYRLARRWTSTQTALLAAGLYLFHPALVFNGAYWGQADSVGAAAALGALTLFLSSHPLAWVLAALAFLIKPQTGPLLAVLGVALVRRSLWPLERPHEFRPRPDLIIAAALIAGATIVLVGAPFHVGPGRLVALLQTAFKIYPYGSVVAFNLWGALQGFWRSDLGRLAGLPLFAWGALAALAVELVILAAVWRRPTQRTILIAAAAALVTTFLLPTRIHERYLIPALPFLALAPAVDRRAWTPYLLLSVLLCLNLLYAYTRPYVQTFLLPPVIDRTLFADVSTRTMSGLAMVALPWLFWVLWRSRREDGPNKTVIQ